MRRAGRVTCELRRARAAAFPLPWWPRRWPASPTTSAMPGSRGGSTLALQARGWPSGPVTAWRCSTRSTRTASTGMTRGGTCGSRTSLTSPESGPVRRSLLISRAELGRCRQFHSVHIPGLATSGGFRGTWLHSCSTRLRSFRRSGPVWPGQVGRPQQDSNLRSRLRRPLLSPLSYGGCYAWKEYH